MAPVATSGDVAIDRGYDYYAADGRALRWVDDAQPTWPNLTGARATFYCGGMAVAFGLIMLVMARRINALMGHVH